MCDITTQNKIVNCLFNIAYRDMYLFLSYKKHDLLHVFLNRLSLQSSPGQK